MTEHCCPTCGRGIDNELVRTTPRPGEGRDTGRRVLDDQWHRDLAELVDLLRKLMADTAGELSPTPYHARKRAESRARSAAHRARLRDAA